MVATNCPDDVKERACEILRAIGMEPLIVRNEIDAHIADRFLEACWREALWLIKDDIATTEEIDDAIRYGFGLRWAQMGLFETYRLAGGEMLDSYGWSGWRNRTDRMLLALFPLEE